MKKFSLNEFEKDVNGILQREELKLILGGNPPQTDSLDGSGWCPDECEIGTACTVPGVGSGQCKTLVCDNKDTGICRTR